MAEPAAVADIVSDVPTLLLTSQYHPLSGDDGHNNIKYNIEILENRYQSEGKE